MKIPGTPSSPASLSPNSLAHSIQSSIVTFCTGINGQTSNDPILGCSPKIETNSFQLLHLYFQYLYSALNKYRL